MQLRWRCTLQVVIQWCLLPVPAVRGQEMTNAVDGEGLKKSVAAALSAGVSRFLLVSAFPESARGETTSESFENYMRVKKMADVELAQSELDWVILRPGALQDKTGTGYVRAARPSVW